jgi:hypothetical protein
MGDNLGPQCAVASALPRAATGPTAALYGGPCRDFGISRKAGYKIFCRSNDSGLETLMDRSRLRVQVCRGAFLHRTKKSGFQQ